MEGMGIFWFRRDLRLEDNHGLHQALAQCEKVLPIFIFDPNILDELPRDDARVTFIRKRLGQMNHTLHSKGYGTIRIYYGSPKEVFQQIIAEFPVAGVYANTDYEPYARERDAEIEKLLQGEQIQLQTFKDQVIFEKNEVVKDDGDPYVVYTPFMKKWKSRFQDEHPPLNYDSETGWDKILPGGEDQQLSLEEMGFRESGIQVPEFDMGRKLVDQYEDTRNYPAKDGTSHLGPHLRFGSVSVRQAVRQALKSENETFLEELIWREFFMQILWHFPRTVHEAFKKPYDRITWRNDEAEFEKWKQGRTGYLLVDAGMRELNQTGYMHNRVRMLVASFLCKHLLIDWRWGEAYFAEKLLDYEMASNVGNWQWAAGSGVDAAPYFRIFNPMTQVDKFDKEKTYIRHWVPEWDTAQYPEPMVDHKMARERCLTTYKAALDGPTS
ncbi:cryptochrome/photolyase family protein [Robiginitalea sediminis]|uniref:cryptochrome/photolyase family protein n=1 Tax=Robiginitalea sediminis TaxID=1982593 RepID=UPI000B4B616E|nr:deoxyribodipyrimidine photo-lyase [Robiginitalea sediminis]